MTDAVGVHAHPTRKLGKRPPKRAATIDVAPYLQLPARPIDDPPPTATFSMDFNDVAGDCVVAAVDHALQTQSVLLDTHRPNWTANQILAYYQTQNPDFRGWGDGGTNRDGGMDIQTFLEHLVHVGDILAFGRINLTEDSLKAAIWVGLAVVTGETLNVAQQAQSTWDYVPSSPIWGGHATVSVAFDPDHQGLVTWGELVEATDMFISHQVEEAWFLLTADLVNHPGFRDSFDLPGFAAAVADLTGGKVIVPVDPIPPAPTPGPGPTDPLADYPLATVNAWLNRSSHLFHTHAERLAATQLRAWQTRHGI